jgi:hypothetical protein
MVSIVTKVCNKPSNRFVYYFSDPNNLQNPQIWQRDFS